MKQKYKELLIFDILIIIAITILCALLFKIERYDWFTFTFTIMCILICLFVLSLILTFM